ncbi:MAG TPA: phosphatase PAP2 family protein [Blastococcus sp.]
MGGASTGMASLPQAPPGPGRSIPATRPAPPAIARVRRRRRPSGEPPPLPRHLNASGKWWLGLSAMVLVAWIVILATGTVTVFDLADTRILQAIAVVRTPWLTQVAHVAGVLATPTAIYVVWLANLAVLAGLRRWRHLFVWIGVGILVVEIGAGMANALQRPRPYEIEILGSWSGFSMPSLPMTVLSTFLVSMAYALVPAGRSRTIAKWVIAGLLVVTALSRLYLAQDHPTDILAGVIFGVAVPLAAFRLLTPNDVYPVRYSRGRPAHLDVTGQRGDAIIRALQDQLGLIASEVKPFGLAGSGGSTPLRITVKGDPDTYVFGKLYAATHVRSDRWYKLGRTLLYGRLEDEQPFHSVRRLVQYEDYVLRVLSDAGLPVAHPLGIVEITPEREYLLVTEFFDGAREIGDADIDDEVIDQGMLAVRRLWEIGLAHRDIKPANVLVRDGTLFLIDTAFAEVRPSPWRQAVDLANMMLVLGLRTSAEQVYARARLQFSDEEIAEAFAATRGLTMPSQLRRMLRQQGKDLHGDFLELLPYRLPPIRIQRWTWRRCVLTVATLFGLFLGVVITATTLLGSPL